MMLASDWEELPNRPGWIGGTWRGERAFYAFAATTHPRQLDRGDGVELVMTGEWQADPPAPGGLCRHVVSFFPAGPEDPEGRESGSLDLVLRKVQESIRKAIFDHEHYNNEPDQSKEAWAAKMIEAMREWADLDAAKRAGKSHIGGLSEAYDRAERIAEKYKKVAGVYPVVVTRGRCLSLQWSVSPDIWDHDLPIDTEERRVSYRLTKRQPRVPHEALLDWSDILGDDDDQG